MRSYHRHRVAAFKKGCCQWVLDAVRQQSSGFQPLGFESLSVRSTKPVVVQFDVYVNSFALAGHANLFLFHALVFHKLSNWQTLWKFKLHHYHQANLLAIELHRRYSKIASQAALQCRFMAPDESGAFALSRIASPIQLSCVEVSYDPG
jgi:hypothetical protein